MSDLTLKQVIESMEAQQFRLLESSKKQNGEPSYSGPACMNRGMAHTIGNWINDLKALDKSSSK